MLTRYCNLIIAVVLLFVAGCAPITYEVVGKADGPVQLAAIHEIGVFDLTARDASGRVLWTDTAYNNLADEGEQLFLDIVLRGATAPANFTLRLFNDTPVETDTIATLTGEPSGNGYAAATIERSAVGWPTLALNSGDYQATSKTVTFTASGGSIGPVTYAVLSDSNNKLISYAALSQSRTLAAGESLSITYRVKLQ